MFAIELNLFSIGTIVIPTHTEFVPKLIYIPAISIVELVQKQLSVLFVKLDRYKI
jgi:hypothetical protein